MPLAPLKVPDEVTEPEPPAEKTFSAALILGVPPIAASEIVALAHIVGELDYYQILHLERTASPKEVKLAYHASSRAYHPDANRHCEEDVYTAVTDIAKVITEAYQVLWWVPAGHEPSVAEGMARLAQLRRSGPEPEAFDFKAEYPAPEQDGRSDGS